MIDLSELNTLVADMRKVPLRAAPKVGRAVRKTALDIERDAKIIAPVDTGNLRNSISTQIVDSRDAIEAVIGPTAEYGIYVEAGTSSMGPQPYMGPAFDRNVSALETALSSLLRGLL